MDNLNKYLEQVHAWGEFSTFCEMDIGKFVGKEYPHIKTYKQFPEIMEKYPGVYWLGIATNAYHFAMKSGNVFVVSKDMYHLIENNPLIPETPGDSREARAKQFLSGGGILFLEKPLFMYQGEDAEPNTKPLLDEPTMQVEAIAWDSVNFASTDDENCTVSVFLGSRIDPSDPFNKFLTCATSLTGKKGSAPKGYAFIVMGKVVYPAFSLVPSLLNFMSGRIVSISHRKTKPESTRQHNKVKGKMGIWPAIQVIQLRDVKYVPSPETETDREPKHIEHDFRWKVREHPRNQFYPSLGIHKLVMVREHEKGPKDKPLKPARVYAVSR